MAKNKGKQTDIVFGMGPVINKKFVKTFKAYCPRAFGFGVTCKEPEVGRRCFYCNIAKLQYGDQDVNDQPSDLPITTKCLGIYIKEVKKRKESEVKSG